MNGIARTKRIRPGRYLVTRDDGTEFWVTRNDEARPTFWNVEPVRGMPRDYYTTDTLGDAKASIAASASAGDVL